MSHTTPVVRHTPSPWGWRPQPLHLPADDAWTTGSVFETLRAYRGAVLAIEEHLERLAASARTLGVPLPQSRRTLAAAIRRMARVFAESDAVIRVMVAPAAFHRRRARLILMGRILRPYPRRWYTHGVAVSTAVTRRFSPATIPPQAKHADLLPGVMARLEGGSEVVELLYRTDDGWLAEGTVSNVCLVTKENVLLTAPPAVGVLAGVTCRRVTALAERLGLAVRRRPFTRHEVWTAAEALLTNTTWEVLPIVRYDGRVIGAGSPGVWTQRLRAAFSTQVQQELSA